MKRCLVRQRHAYHFIFAAEILFKKKCNCELDVVAGVTNLDVDGLKQYTA